MDASMKYGQLVKLNAEYTDLVVIAWFPDTKAVFESYLAEANIKLDVHLARSISSAKVDGKTALFLERYPLKSKEDILIMDWQTNQLLALVSLDEPMMKLFGGERILELMRKLGMAEDEVIEHTLISNAISKAQEKLDKSVQFEASANSMKEWFERNVKG